MLIGMARSMQHTNQHAELLRMSETPKYNKQHKIKSLYTLLTARISRLSIQSLTGATFIQSSVACSINLQNRSI
jgi:hypothetical protein